MTSRILVVEDDRVARELLEEILRAEGHEVRAVADGETAIAEAAPQHFDLVISDIRLGDGASGMEVLAAWRTKAPNTPVILITAFGDVTGAMAAIQKGAHDYVSKPFDVQELTTTVRRALERTRLLEESRAQRAGGREKNPAAALAAIVGRSAAMLDVYKMVARVAGSQSTVLVVGESGTGKELVARAIHNHSTRGAEGKPFVAVNCTALTESLLESELFGHQKGAFTGAVAHKRGLFEEAQGGTLFLDEIGDVPPKMQAQLLRVLQEGEFRRVGGTEAVHVDVRIVAATNRELEEEVRAGRFREDLYFRINVVTIRLPPLRERPEDIPLLAQHFLVKYAARERRADAGVAPAAMEILEAYAWPGNVRELENVIERALALSKDGVILPSDLPAEVSGDPDSAQGAVATPAARTPSGPAALESATTLYADRPTLAELERRYIDLILKETGGNKKRAAEILGIDRRTLYRSLEKSGERVGDDE